MDYNYEHNQNSTENREWHQDDFEQAVKNAVPKDKAISVYKPRIKRLSYFSRHPLLVSVISSLMTCSIFLGVFTLILGANNPNMPQITQIGTTTEGHDTLQQVTHNTSEDVFSLPEVYDKTSPTVVSILSTLQGGGYLQSQTSMSSGSGVIIRDNGYIVTNNHVVEGATSIQVQTIAGQSFEAQVVGTDERTDLAVLKVESDQSLPSAELGDSSNIRVGDIALAIGNPLRDELAGTLTVGYISAINRSMVIDGKQMTMLQTDAAINPGNSGGALLNKKGQLIGINTAKSTGYDVEGLGFAIPINEAKPVIESIIEHGYVTGRPLVGITAQNITEAIGRANDLPVGVYVRSVTAFGAAERAGIKVGDVIVAFDGEKIETIDDINAIRDTHKVGDSIQVKIKRDGKTIETELVLQEEKPSSTQSETEGTQQQIPSDFFSWFN
ncbi:MAG: trypsin-like serine protease [Ruminococcaceae bacterium]|nr:trypsin-like serine protease [Oscillospiraceae bacterium]